MGKAAAAPNTLYYGDNLDILRRYIDDESVDLIYLDPPFNSNADYNVLFAEKDGSQAHAQIQAFEDTWEWGLEAEQEYAEVLRSGHHSESHGRVAKALKGLHDFLGGSANSCILQSGVSERNRSIKMNHCPPFCLVSSLNTRGACLLFLGIVVGLIRPSFAGQTEFAGSVRSLLRDYVELDKKSVGVAVGLVDEHGSQIICYGKTDNPASPELNGDTVFEIGSITKVFTTLLLQDMVDRGEMKLDDPVQMYLPKSVKMPTRNGKEITLLHLATHSSGLPRDADNMIDKDKSNANNPYAHYTAKQLYDFLSGYTLTRDPGEKWEYSNLGVGLLGHVIALKAGSDYESLVLQRICRPLKMDSTCIALTPQLKARLALGHTTSGELSGSMDFQTLLGNGALRSTANDMLKFLSANCGLTRCDLGPAMERTRVVHIEHQALGWSEGDPGTFWKNGGTFGYRCDAGFQPAKHRGVIVLSNSCGSDDEIDEIAYVLTLAEWHSDAKTMKVDPQIYDLYAGEYRLPDASIITVHRQLDRLVTQRKGHLTGELLPKSESTFFGRISGREVTFVRGPDGKVTELALSTNDKNKPVIATRLSKTTQP